MTELLRNQTRVTEKTHPTLGWEKKPHAAYVGKELIQSDAFRELTKIETDIWLFILSKRSFEKGKMDYWNPRNKDNLVVTLGSVCNFFKGKDRGMLYASPSAESIRRAFNKFMTVGFISLSHQGGSGPGDKSIYRFENNWRLWKKGDPPCFSKAGMMRGKGFCVPNSGQFNKTAKSNMGGRE